MPPALWFSLAVDMLDAVEEKLVCRLDTLDLLRMEPVRDRAVCVWAWAGAWGCWFACWMAMRVIVPLCETFGSSRTLVAAASPWDSRMLPSPVGEGNWVNVKSPEADSRLLWRSSKLTWGRKSWWAAWGSCSSGAGLGAVALRPKENREWLFWEEALSIGAPLMEERFEWRRLVGLGISLLGCLLLKQERASLSVTGAMVKGRERVVSCHRCMVNRVASSR